MKKEYKIKLLESGKQLITYYVNDKEILSEHYAGVDGVVVTEIQEGYVEKQSIASRVAKTFTEPVIGKSVVVEGKEYTLVEKKLSWWRRFLSIFK